MLATMSFNAGIFVSAMAGFGVGHFLFSAGDHTDSGSCD
jgi:hypothetical protein